MGGKNTQMPNEKIFKHPKHRVKCGEGFYTTSLSRKKLHPQESGIFSGFYITT